MGSGDRCLEILRPKCNSLAQTWLERQYRTPVSVFRKVQFRWLVHEETGVLAILNRGSNGPHAMIERRPLRFAKPAFEKL